MTTQDYKQCKNLSGQVFILMGQFVHCPAINSSPDSCSSISLAWNNHEKEMNIAGPQFLKKKHTREFWYLFLAPNTYCPTLITSQKRLFGWLAFNRQQHFRQSCLKYIPTTGRFGTTLISVIMWLFLVVKVSLGQTFSELFLCFTLCEK